MTKKHMLLMAACCLIPIGLIVAIGALAIPVSSIASFAIILICPLMMLFMMRGMQHGDHAEHSEQHTHHPVPTAEQKQIGGSVDRSAH